MAKVKVVLNRPGLFELMKSTEISGALEELADKALESLGEGYEKSVYSGRNRVNVSVGPATKQAYRETLETNNVIKAVFGS